MPTHIISQDEAAKCLNWHKNELRSIRLRLRAQLEEIRERGDQKLYFNVKELVEWLRSVMRLNPEVALRLYDASRPTQKQKEMSNMNFEQYKMKEKLALQADRLLQEKYDLPPGIRDKLIGDLSDTGFAGSYINGSAPRPVSSELEAAIFETERGKAVASMLSAQSDAANAANTASLAEIRAIADPAQRINAFRKQQFDG